MSIIYLIALGIVTEFFTERIKFGLLPVAKKLKLSTYSVYWTSPIVAFLLAYLFVWGSLKEALIITAFAMIWFEISHIWKQKKRDMVPISTEGLKDKIVGEEGEININELVKKLRG